MPTKFERERDEARLARIQKVSQQIKETDQQMSRDTSRTLLLYTGDIEPDPEQPRRLYEEDQGALEELSASIRQLGVLSPIQVRPHPAVPNHYLIIVGERRWRACRMAGVNRIEAVVREDWDAFQIRAAQYEENEKRQDVSDMARARSLAAMRSTDAGKRRSWDEMAERVGLQRNQVMRLVGLMQLPSSVQELIDRRLLPGTHGFELVRLLKHVPDEEILHLAQSSCAGTPGTKAARPAKELARLVTDRLQAAYEASHGGAEPAPPPEAGSVVPGLPSTQTPLGADVTALQTWEGPQEATHATDAPEDTPRSFILDLDRAWKAGELRPSEQQIIQGLVTAYPLVGPSR